MMMAKSISVPIDDGAIFQVKSIFRDYLLSPAYSSSSVTRQRSALSSAGLIVASIVSLLENRTM